MSNISEKLDENIERYLDEIAVGDVDSEYSEKAIDAVVRLHKLRAEEIKLEIEANKQKADAEDKEKSRETELKKIDLDNERIEVEKKRVNIEESRQILETQKLSCDELARNEDEKERKKERWFKFGVAAAEIVLPLAVYGTLAFIGYAREFDGTICSSTLKDVIKSIRKK